ncbi:tetratricopeptide repeat protein [Corynebacterium stationis]|uniref:tetratricopeptide repeat protein n=2 Tax=Corynebacterium stationis TaxID=1705 RepID=UPI0009EE08B8|nr:tetratricopeptide repeat protein [Corynebacterium stationis]WLP86593.1 hypothetical protein Q9G90_09745 [Corynebacterium stationis]
MSERYNEGRREESRGRRSDSHGSNRRDNRQSGRGDRREWNNERQDRQGRGDWKSRGENDRGRRSDGRPGSSRGNWREDRNDRDERRGGGDRREGGRRDWQSRGERGGDNRDNRRGDRRNDERRGDSRGRGHANRGGRAEQERAGRNLAPQRSGFREERINRRMADPDLPDDIDINDLDPLILQDLRVLSKDNAEETAKHMIMAAEWMEDDPQLALRHARAAKDRAGRVAVAREVNGIAAYHAGEWKEALAELRAARRISGGPGMLAVMADCERGLGRPEKAIELGRSEEAQQVDAETAIELAIVVAGARQDLGQNDSAVVTLQRANPSKDAKGIPAMRLSYAYANALAEAGRKEEAKEWFEHTAKLDVDQWTDAHERLKEF